MRNTHKIEVDGVEYSVTYFSATKSLEVLVELSKIAGESVAALFSESGSILDVDAGKILPAAIKGLVSNLDKTTTVALIKTLCDSVSKNGQPILPVFDIEFAGRTGHLLKLVKSVIGVQYGDLKNVLGALAEMQAVAPVK